MLSQAPLAKFLEKRMASKLNIAEAGASCDAATGSAAEDAFNRNRPMLPPNNTDQLGSQLESYLKDPNTNTVESEEPMPVISREFTVATLMQKEISRAHACEFVLGYNLTWTAIQQDARKKEAVDFLSRLVSDYDKQYHIDNRDADVSIYDFSTSITLILIGFMQGEPLITNWLAKVNSNWLLRGHLTALLPSMLPPWQRYNKSTMCALFNVFACAQSSQAMQATDSANQVDADCSTTSASNAQFNAYQRESYLNKLEACESLADLIPDLGYEKALAAVKAGEAAPPLSCSEEEIKERLYNLFGTLRNRNQTSKLADILLEFNPAYGFLRNEYFKFSTPRFIVIGFDGQELRATYLEKDGSSSSNYTTVNVFNCTFMCSLAFRIRTKKNHEREAFLEMLERIKKDFDLSQVIFVADALNTTPEIVQAIQAAGAYFLLTVKGNNGNKQLRATMLKLFEINQNSENMHTFVSKPFTEVGLAHGRQEQVTIRAIKLSNCANEASLLDDQLSASLSNSFSKYPQAVSIMSYDKDTAKKRKSYSKEALAKLNKCSKTEEKQRHSLAITNVDVDFGENFLKLVCARAELWLYEVAHFHTDGNLEQDRIQLCNENSIIARVGMNKIALDLAIFARHHFHVDDGTKRAPSVHDTFSRLQDPSTFLDLLTEFLFAFCDIGHK